MEFIKDGHFYIGENIENDYAIRYTEYKGNKLIDRNMYDIKLMLERRKQDEYGAQLSTLKSLVGITGISFKEVAYGKNKEFLPEDDSIPDTSRYEGMTTEELEALLDEIVKEQEKN